jgi:indole-3-glycerol phosphate synthase
MSVLKEIIAYKREEVAARKAARAWAQVESLARTQTQTRGFAAALKAARRKPALIAEIKKASPSRGVIRVDFDPPMLAQAYAQGGATCLSVLTDAPSFQGDDVYLAMARAACALPVLRKDFMIDVWQIAESRALGADAVLIIMAAVDDALAADLAAAAADFDMDALVEVHDDAELERAARLGAQLIGVNNRSLSTFRTELATTERLGPQAPAGALLISESGIFTQADMARVARAGAHAVLVGESLMRAEDVAAATEDLLRT